MTIDLEKQILEQADKEDKQRRAEYARKLKEHLISMPKVFCMILSLRLKTQTCLQESRNRT